MPKKMLVNMSDPDECRVAVVENGRLSELFIEHASAEHYVGNIYKGRIENIEPSIQAAFVDLGLERNGFLHVSDVNPDYMKQTRVKKGGQFPRLQNVLRRGQEVVVQVTKSGIGTKGPALTTYMSLAGRFLVLMPNIKRHGVSRKIENDEQRQRLKEALQQMNAPTDMGVIVRTAGDGRTKRELQRDLAYLQRLYTAITKRIKQTKAPALIYQESDLVTRVIRDFFTPDTDEVIVDSESVRKKAIDFLQGVMPRYAARVKLYQDEAPLFHAYGVEKEIESIYARRVELPGGAYLVIDQAEALVAIDVNSGSFRERRDPEENSYQLNMLAAKEVARQLRLRDLGGVIVIDFIDMLDQKHRRDVEKALSDELKLDKARYKVLKMSDFGIVEMTRQRMRPSVRRSMFQECPYCQGTGQLRSVESMAIAILRLLPLALAREDATSVQLTVSRDVALHLNNTKRRDIVCIEDKFKKSIAILGDVSVSTEYMRFVCFDRHGVASECNPTCEVVTEPILKVPEQAQRERKPKAEPPARPKPQPRPEPAKIEAEIARPAAKPQPQPEPVPAPVQIEPQLEKAKVGAAEAPQQPQQEAPSHGEPEHKAHRSRRHRGRGSRARRSARKRTQTAGTGAEGAKQQAGGMLPVAEGPLPSEPSGITESPHPLGEPADERPLQPQSGQERPKKRESEPSRGENGSENGGDFPD